MSHAHHDHAHHGHAHHQHQAAPAGWNRAFALGIALFLAFTHRANLQRLRRGTESRFERVRLFRRRRAGA